MRTLGNLRVEFRIQLRIILPLFHCRFHLFEDLFQFFDLVLLCTLGRKCRDLRLQHDPHLKQILCKLNMIIHH